MATGATLGPQCQSGAISLQICYASTCCVINCQYFKNSEILCELQAHFLKSSFVTGDLTNQASPSCMTDRRWQRRGLSPAPAPPGERPLSSHRPGPAGPARAPAPAPAESASGFRWENRGVSSSPQALKDLKGRTEAIPCVVGDEEVWTADVQYQVSVSAVGDSAQPLPEPGVCLSGSM